MLLGTVDNPSTVPVSSSLTSAWVSCMWIPLSTKTTDLFYRLLEGSYTRMNRS